MNMSTYFASLLTVLSLLNCTKEIVAAGLKPQPNIIFLITDDQGYGDISRHGNPILKTPNLDRLHDEGVRFTDFMVSPTCSPTRSALITGRHEFKNGVTHTILERERLTPQATTIAQVLKSVGYTTGIFGKWHLGDEPEYWPSRRGFDEMYIHGGGGIGQSYPGSCGDAPGNTYFNPTLLHNGKFEKTMGYCTDLFFDQAIQWIDSVRGRQPFYCYIATNAPHLPLQVRPEDEQRYADKVSDPKVAKFFGMIANIDDNVGKLLSKLKAWDIDQNTLFVFISDNGGTLGVPIFNAGMRGQKGSPWVGGIRASSFWRWPGTLPPHDVTALAAHVDFFPTITELSGAKLDDHVSAQVEGRSLVPLLKQENVAWPDRALFTHVGRWPKDADPNQHKYQQCSVRTSQWQLVNVDQGSSKKWQLFNLTNDPGEKNDVAVQHPDIVYELDRKYDEWWASIVPQLVNEKAVGPAENPFKTLYRQQFGEVPN